MAYRKFITAIYAAVVTFLLLFFFFFGFCAFSCNSNPWLHVSNSFVTLNNTMWYDIQDFIPHRFLSSFLFSNWKWQNQNSHCSCFFSWRSGKSLPMLSFSKAFPSFTLLNLSPSSYSLLILIHACRAHLTNVIKQQQQGISYKSYLTLAFKFLIWIPLRW